MGRTSAHLTIICVLADFISLKSLSPSLRLSVSPSLRLSVFKAPYSDTNHPPTATRDAWAAFQTTLHNSNSKQQLRAVITLPTFLTIATCALLPLPHVHVLNSQAPHAASVHTCLSVVLADSRVSITFPSFAVIQVSRHVCPATATG